MVPPPLLFRCSEQKHRNLTFNTEKALQKHILYHPDHITAREKLVVANSEKDKPDRSQWTVLDESH